jgi:hypothetical protein
MAGPLLSFCQRICKGLGLSKESFQKDLDELKILCAKPLLRDIPRLGILSRLQDAEFKVFSQFGDDGIIQYLLHHLRPLPDSFVEFGVQDYRESNTRFLLLNNNWSGLVMDGSEHHVRFIQQDDIYWRHNLTARCAFIDRENINSLIQESGFCGEIGLLSIDIDGNDYWVWESLTAVDPVMVIVEYNSLFGPEAAVTVPYDPLFIRHQAHYSGQFWGASLQAFAVLAQRKDYALVGCNSAGNNAYFVRRDRLGALPEIPVRQAFVQARFRDTRDLQGRLYFCGASERLELIGSLSVHDLTSNKLVLLRSLLQK